MDRVVAYPEDAALAALAAEPFALHRPARQSVPFVFASPHSGRLYPTSFLAASRLDALSLRKSEDAYVDEIFAAATHCGAPLIAARFPRAFVDVNRAASELDPAMFDGPLAMGAVPRTARVAAGLGVIPRVVRDGLEIYHMALPPEEASFRLTALYRSYHGALARLVDETHARFGVCVVVDCHSMPSAARAADIVIGDRHGEAAAQALIAHAQAALAAQGFSVSRNTPYAGGHTTALYGVPARGLHALQIEVGRALYLDEERIEKRAGFTALVARLTGFVEALVDIDANLLARPFAEVRPRTA